MTVKELIKELKQYPQDAHVFLNNDWDAVEDGHYTDLTEISNTCDDVKYIDEGMDWIEEHAIILE